METVEKSHYIKGWLTALGKKVLHSVAMIMLILLQLCNVEPIYSLYQTLSVVWFRLEPTMKNK